MKHSLGCIARAAVVCVAVTASACGARAAEVSAVPSPPPESEYVIAVDDVLTVAFWQDQIAATEVVVRPDGKISLPLLNDVQAAGHTPRQLATVLEKLATRFITEPEATVIVKQIRSRKVFVLGEVTTAGAVPLNGEMTVLQLIAVGGGLLEYAKKEDIVVIRNQGGHEKRFKFNYNEVVKGKNIAQNIFLQPGDVVVVP